MRVGGRPRALVLLAEEDRFAGAPARVERKLRAKVRRRGWRRLSWVVAAPVAAALAVAVWMAVPRGVAESMELARFSPAAPAMALTEPARAPAKVPVLPSRPALGPRRVAVRPRAGALRFYELAYAPPEMLVNSQVVRVRVPRAALLSFGLSLDAYRPVSGPVEADLLITEDGIARAIRFVPPSQYFDSGVHERDE